MEFDFDVMKHADFYGIDAFNQSWKRITNYSFRSKPRPQHGLCFIKSGILEYTDGSEKFRAYKGDIVFLKQHSQYRVEFISNEDEEPQNILVNFYIRGDLTPAKQLCVIHAPEDEASRLFSLLVGVCSHHQSLLAVKASFYNVISLLEGTAKQSLSDDLSEKAKKILDNSVGDKVSDEYLAAQCNISVSTLQRHFKNSFGITVSDYRTNLVVSTAKQLLLSGNCNVSLVADMLGFTDTSYFCKTFRRVTGISPGEFVRIAHII